MLHPTEPTTNQINNSSESCIKWSEIYNNCQMKSGMVESTASDQRPTGTITNTAETDASENSSDKMAMIVGTVIGGMVFVFLLTVITLTAIVCLRKRRLRKASTHLINGPIVLELKCKQI